MPVEEAHVDGAALDLELGDREVAARHVRARDRRAPRFSARTDHPRRRLRRLQGQRAVGAVRQADGRPRRGRVHRCRCGTDARHGRGAGGRARADRQHHRDQRKEGQDSETWRSRFWRGSSPRPGLEGGSRRREPKGRATVHAVRYAVCNRIFTVWRTPEAPPERPVRRTIRRMRAPRAPSPHRADRRNAR